MKRPGQKKKFAPQKTVPQQKRRCGSSKRSSSKKMSVSFFCRTKSIRTRIRMQKWRQNFRVCRQEMKGEAVMLRRHAIAAWRPCGNKLSLWERIGSRLCSKGTEKWERIRSRCQEEKKEEGIVKTDKSKTKPVSSWRCHLQAGAMKALQREVLELDLPPIRGASGECGGAGNSGAAKDERKRPLSNSPS